MKTRRQLSTYKTRDTEGHVADDAANRLSFGFYVSVVTSLLKTLWGKGEIARYA